MAQAVNQSPGACGCVAPSCLMTFTIKGCNLSLLSGATVTIWTDATKVTQLDTQTTNGSGVAVLDVGTAGTYYYEVSYGVRMLVSSNTVAITCGGTRGLTLTPASGYHCASFCAEPLKDTLTGTFSSALPTITLTYNVPLGTWRGTGTFAFPGFGPTCTAPFNVPLALTFGTLLVGNDAAHGLAICPGAGSPSVNTNLTTTSTTCPPSFSLVESLASSTFLTTLLSGAAPGTVTFTE